jgi:hypothetical protein
MGKVYHHASKVLVWLGCEIDDTPVAFELLSKLKAVKLKHELQQLSDMMSQEFFPIESNGPDPWENIIHQMKAQFQRQTATGLTSDGLILHLGDEERESLPGFQNPQWKALDALLARPWFTRVWVLQEVILSKDAVLICGQRSICWEDFSLATDCLYKLLLPIAPVRMTLMPMWIKRHRGQLKRNDPPGLLEMLFTSASLNCTDQRDIVYGLLGIVAHDVPTSLLIDYGLSLEEIFKNTAISLLHEKKNLAVLAAVNFPKRCQNLPSWVPDWTIIPPSPNLSSGYPWYQASGKVTKPSQVKVSDNGLSITIPAAFVANIGALGERMPLGKADDRSSDIHDSAQRQAEVFEQWRNFALNADLPRSKTQPYGQTLEEAFWRTLVCDLDESTGAPADPSFQYNYKHFYSKLKSARRGLYNNQVPWLEDPLAVSGGLAMTFGMSDPDAKTFWLATVKVLGSRLAIMKSLGWFGIVPDNTRVGDFVCIFEGGKVPFVVRREGKSGGVLIGPCFVHGMMDGNMFESVKSSFGLCDVCLR